MQIFEYFSRHVLLFYHMLTCKILNGWVGISHPRRLFTTPRLFKTPEYMASTRFLVAMVKCLYSKSINLCFPKLCICVVTIFGQNGLDLHRSITDQCAHGATIDGQLIRKSTELWSNNDIQANSPNLELLCNKRSLQPNNV